jgi:hypothetical protein
MIALLLQLFLFLQGIPLPPAATGVVMGELKTEGGKPAAGVRVAAMAKPNSTSDISAVSSFAALTETDAFGHFKLENIPPGPYYIVAGRVDFPTYYPGATSISSGKLVSVSSEKTVSGIDFVLKDATLRPASSLPSLSFYIPVEVRAENSGKVPLFSSRGVAAIRLEATAAAWFGATSLAETYASLPSSTLEYRFAVENLPDGFTVKSASYGTTNLMTETLKVSGPVQTLVVTLTQSDPQPVSGVRVTGKSSAIESRAAAISGVPGVFYTDGTFEFRGVPPGRHTIIAIGDRRSNPIMAASIVVRSENIDGVDLVNVPVLPEKTRVPLSEQSGTLPPGPILPLASIYGRIVEEETKMPVTQGEGFIFGDDWKTFPVDANGMFEIKNLLPGNYSIAFQMVGYPTIQRAITVGDEDQSVLMVEPN